MYRERTRVRPARKKFDAIDEAKGAGLTSIPGVVATGAPELETRGARLTKAGSDLRRAIRACVRSLAPRLRPVDRTRMRGYLRALAREGESPPRLGRGFHWSRIAIQCGVPRVVLMTVRDDLRPVLWALADAASISAHPPCPKGAGPTPLRNPQKAQTAKRQGRKPTPIVEFPVAIEDHWDETRCFRDALDLHMRRHGDTGWRLHAAIVRPGETFNISTLASWRRGVRAPQDALSFEVLARIERRYRLSEGYFKSKLGNAPRATRGAAVLGLSEAEMRRLAWHLPDDFRRRPINEQHEIVDWVRRVIVSGSTDYRRFQAAALKQRYGLKLGSSAGDVEPAATTRAPQGAISGITGPCVLVREMAELVAFKSATLSTFGYERSGVWGSESVDQRVEHFGLLFGALAAATDGPIQGASAPRQALCLALLALPEVWDWYVQWRERRRGFYTKWEAELLRIGASFLRERTGWIRQTPRLAARLQPIEGLVSPAQIAEATSDWNAACDRG